MSTEDLIDRSGSILAIQAPGQTPAEVAQRIQETLNQGDAAALAATAEAVRNRHAEHLMARSAKMTSAQLTQLGGTREEEQKRAAAIVETWQAIDLQPLAERFLRDADAVRPLNTDPHVATQELDRVDVQIQFPRADASQTPGYKFIAEAVGQMAGYQTKLKGGGIVTSHEDHYAGPALPVGREEGRSRSGSGPARDARAPLPPAWTKREGE